MTFVLSHTIYNNKFQTDCILIDYSISYQYSEHKCDLQKRKKKEEKRKALENNNGLADKKSRKVGWSMKEISLCIEQKEKDL